MICNRNRIFVMTLALMALNFHSLSAQDEKETGETKTQETTTIEFGEGTLRAEAPASWNKVEPKFNLIEVEFAVPKVEGDEQDGRLTIMPSGGGVEGNIERWKSQFSGKDGGPAEEPKVEELTVNGMKAHLVDLSGSYADRPGGPNSPPTIRENYRLLGAILETESKGMYFFKFYGGAATMEANADLFRKFIESITVVE